MTVDPQGGKGELRHIGAPHDDQPGGPEAGDGGAVPGGRRRAPQRLRSARRHLAGDVVEVLDRHRNSGVGGRRHTQRPGAVHGPGGGPRLVGVDLEKGPRPLAGVVVDAGQAFVDQGAAGDASGFEVR